MLPSFKLSRRFVAAAALAFSAAGLLPTFAAEPPANDTHAAKTTKAPAKSRAAFDNNIILNSEKFKFIEERLLETTVREGITSEKLRAAAVEGINKYLDELPAGKKPDATDLETAALQNMLSSLSPHDDYMDKKQTKAFAQRMSGSFAGVGVQMDKKTHETSKHFKIEKPMANSPAERAGIKAGDIIKEVKGANDSRWRKLDGLSFEDGISLIGGEAGTKVDLRILRDGKLIDFSVTRASIKQEVVNYKMLEGGIAHIYVATFTSNVTADVRKAVAQAKADAQLDPAIAANGGLKGVILDLTFDGGGSLGESVRMVDDFLDKEGPVVTQQGRLAEFTDRLAATHGDIINGLPLVVLVNEMSASASEIVAGAFQDHNRATIIGRDTFGKGTVQMTYPLPDGTIIKNTIAIFKRPSGHSNQWVGVKPDVLVETLNADYEKMSAEIQTEKSLPNSIRNDQGFEAEKDKTKFTCSPVRRGIKIEEAGTDKNIFNEESGKINPFIACARDFILKQANPAYTPKFTNTVPKPLAPTLTN